ncbi:MAG TPA: hypothetical protein DEQ09_08965, partial [Bacteroidales bacterium]|nr:hypothetical protein [Bacteroidales bacterium]
MTFKEQEQFTKKNSDDLLKELSNYHGEDIISEIVRLGIQSLMELERDEHIGVGSYENCRVDGKIIDIACLIAIGIDSEGYRHVLGMDTAWSEIGDSWDRFIGGLKERRLKGVRLFTSDDHPGIHPAIKKYYPGAVWQRCQSHFSVNAMDLFPKSRRDEVYQRLKEVWDCKKYE